MYLNFDVKRFEKYSFSYGTYHIDQRKLHISDDNYWPANVTFSFPNQGFFYLKQYFLYKYFEHIDS